MINIFRRLCEAVLPQPESKRRLLQSREGVARSEDRSDEMVECRSRPKKSPLSLGGEARGWLLPSDHAHVACHICTLLDSCRLEEAEHLASYLVSPSFSFQFISRPCRV